MSELKCELTIQYKTKRGTESKTLSGSEFAFGRNPDSALIIKDGFASRVHFKIFLADGILQIQDPGSTNGTLLNGKKIESKKSYKLKVGDIVGIGNSEFSMEIFNFVLPEEEAKIPAMLGIPAPEAFPTASRETVITDLPKIQPQLDDVEPPAALPNLAKFEVQGQALVEESKQKANRTLESANQEAKSLLESANQEAKSLLERVNKEAKRLLDNANQEANRIIATSVHDSKAILEKANQDAKVRMDKAEQDSNSFIEKADAEAKTRFEKTLKEAEAVLEKSKLEAAAIVEQARAEISKELESNKLVIESNLADSKNEVTKILQEAQSESDRIVQLAKTEGERLVQETSAKVSALELDAKSKIEKLDQEKSELQKSVEDIRQVLKSLEDQRANYQQQISKLNQENLELEKQNQVLQQTSKELQSSNMDWTRKNSELSLQHNDWMARNQAAAAELNQIKSEIKDQQQRKTSNEIEFEKRKLQLSADLATQERTNLQIFNSMKKKIEGLEGDERVALAKLAKTQESCQQQEQAALQQLELKKSELAKEFEEIKKTERAKLDEYLAEEAKVAQKKHRDLIEDLIHSAEKIANHISMEIEKLLVAKMDANQIKDVSDSIRQITVQQLRLKSAAVLTEAGQKLSAGIKVRSRAAKNLRPFLAGFATSASLALVYIFGFSTVNWSGNPVQQDMANKLQERKEDLAKRKFNPVKSLEIKDNLMDSVIYTEGFVEAYSNENFKLNLTKSANVFMLKTFLVSEEKTIAAVGTLAATIQALEEKKQGIHPDFVNKDLAKMAEFEKQQLEKIKDLLGTEVRVEALLKHQKDFFLQYQKRTPATQN